MEKLTEIIVKSLDPKASPDIEAGVTYMYTINTFKI